MAFTVSSATKNNEKKRDSYGAAAETFGYDKNNQYAQDVDKYYGQIANMKPFEYDVTGDALYQQYKDTYTQQGKMAMQDTMGQAAAMTGGYDNSYAQTVGQQVFNGYMGQLADKIPELYQLAYSKYRDDKSDLYNLYGLARENDADLYGKAVDEQSRNLGLASYYGSLASEGYNREYGEHRDSIADRQYADQFAYQKEQDDIAKKLAGGYAYDENGNLTYVGSGDSKSTLTAEWHEVIGNCAAFREARDPNGLAFYLDGLEERGDITEAEADKLWEEYHVIGAAQVYGDTITF